MRICYNCHYDGRECDKEIPKLNKDGVVISPSNKKIKTRYRAIISKETLDDSWDVCQDCDRNHTIGGFCHGCLNIKER